MMFLFCSTFESRCGGGRCFELSDPAWLVLGGGPAQSGRHTSQMFEDAHAGSVQVSHSDVKVIAKSSVYYPMYNCLLSAVFRLPSLVTSTRINISRRACSFAARGLGRRLWTSSTAPAGTRRTELYLGTGLTSTL